MIELLLKTKPFQLKGFLDELNEKELSLLFLLTHNDGDGLELFYEQVDDIDRFLKTANSVLSINKIPKDAIKGMIDSKYNDGILFLLYRTIYRINAEKEAPLVNKSIFAIECFISKYLHKINAEEKTKKLSEKVDLDGIREIKKFIISSNRPVLNTLLLIKFLARMDAGKPEFKKFLSIRDEIIQLLLEQFEEINHKQLEISNKILANYEKKLNQAEETIDKRNNVISKKNEKNKELSHEIKRLQNELKKRDSLSINKVDEVLIKQLEEDIQSQAEKYEKYINTLKTERDKWETTFSMQLDKSNQEVMNLKKKEQSLIIENKALTQELELYKLKKSEIHIEDYLNTNKITKHLYELIKPHMEKFEKQMEEEQKALEEKKQEILKAQQKIGYCHIEDNKHFVIFPDSSKIEIMDLPETTYLGENQFVKVTMDGSFKWAYAFKYNESDKDYLIHEFCSVVFQNGEPYAAKELWNTRKIENLPNYIRLKENQVISINGKGELLRYYRVFQHNIDHYMPSIKAKGQIAYYILKILPNGMLLRNIETGEEEFTKIEINNQEVKEEEIIYVKDDQLIFVHHFSKIYTSSSYYKKAENGVVEIRDSVVFAQKLSGEVVIVNEIPENVTMKNEDVIKIDEFNNFLMFNEYNIPIKETDEQKKLRSLEKNVSSKKEKENVVNISKDVLIIGKITYENSYKLSLLKKGYRTEVIDGYESWSKINIALKKKDIIVVITEFVSHSNMWKLKDAGLDIPIIYPENDGANRVADEVENMLKTIS